MPCMKSDRMNERQNVITQVFYGTQNVPVQMFNISMILFHYSMSKNASFVCECNNINNSHNSKGMSA